MSRRNWINLFSNSQSTELPSDLERGYEAALLIQSLELEYYGDRRIRPDLKLSVPRSVQLNRARYGELEVRANPPVAVILQFQALDEKSRLIATLKITREFG